jgi:two-component system chemotaxis response regulator CheB
VQHISRGFSPGFASWLNDASALTVKMAEHGETPQPGTVYVAGDDHHLGVSVARRIELSDAPAVGGFRPSATPLFESVAVSYRRSALAVILTGMGRDGVDGLRSIRRHGGRTIAESEATAVIFGMPGAAVSEGFADFVFPLDQICTTLAGLLVVGDPRREAVR